MDESKKSAASSADASNDKVMAAVSAFPIIGLIVYFAMKDASDYVRNYARQGALLFLFSFLGAIPGVNCVVGVLLLVGVVWLLVSALQGKEDFKLPLVGDLAYSVFK